MMKKIVTIGGGTGNFVLLSGLKKYPIRLSAIVSMADDGGSTGVLRDELGVLPPGDVRQCLVALSNSSEKMRELMNYRFEKGGLKGHSFGNLLLSALEKINKGFLNGLEEASQILDIKGEVIPVTDFDTNLYMELNDGEILRSENQINTNFEIEKKGIKKIYLKPEPRANKKAIQRIKEADMIVIGPGGFYCSILPNLLVEGIPQAIYKSKAIVVFNCNLVNKKGHTERLTLDDYIDEINKYLGGERINFATFNNKKMPDYLIKKYHRKGERLIRFLKNARKKRNYKIIITDLSDTKPLKFSKLDPLIKIRSLIRHNPDKLAKTLMFLLELKENKNLVKAIV
ncbi:MAG: Gluconeogenesis factor [Syntrophomonadaceae bacterium]|nr:Gluconeogenesis factor [Bacillota bacterium]